MGEIAEMMIDGTLCQACGEYIEDGEAEGFPRFCSEECRPETTIQDVEWSLEFATNYLEVAIRDLKKLKIKGVKELAWLIKRIEKFKGKTMPKNKMLTEIIAQIKKINDEREKNEQPFISEDDSNEVISLILKKFNLIDDADVLESVFGITGLHEIRDAEQGIY